MYVKHVWVWLIPLTLLWPILHLVVYFVRFGDIPSNAADILVFLPMSFISGIIFLALWVRISSLPQKIWLVSGYLISSPIAFMGSLLSGLVYQPIIGTFLWGAGPLIIGMLVSLLVGSILFKIGSHVG